ncbi:S53 family peptidase [Ktedonospora formicarum]|uniref:Peptidase S53 domain-containing protein n=1 Tax=Ktedonospora formicarum TaxID=2778364 RepID=A0A8J3MQ11_9CHLR|nr:S53 family peptidase [Ktedonospora formicarum]GHO43480.1 hypothetical protein KSX_16430 [Ktedonospora formicarum]
MRLSRTHLASWRYVCILILLGMLLASCSVNNPFTGLSGQDSTSQPKLVNASTTCPEDLKQVTSCLTPYSMRQIYGIQSLIDKGYTGKGQTIIDIVSFGSPTLKKDLDVFSKQFGLPPANVEVIAPLNIPESDPHGDKSGWADETSLDVQIIHALAPEAKIVVLQSPVAETQGTIGLPEFRQLEQYVIDHNVGAIVSQSWGASELTLNDATGQQELQKWDALLQEGTTRKGITYFSSSGDHGATDYADLDSKHLGNVPATSFAASSPWITSVGGTSVRQSAGHATTASERAWNGSGGGFSSIFKMPSYQQSLPGDVQQQFQGRRGVPDVSGDADPYTGLAFYQNGVWNMAGGTSASAPVWAAVMALANQMAGRPLGFINPTLYKLAQSPQYNQLFNDITVGNNNNQAANVKGYPAVKGWDAVTGLGTPRVDKLVPALVDAMKKSS